ncbi:MAG: hypothetical protein QM811_06880 [Pirellulales bacterium]
MSEAIKLGLVAIKRTQLLAAVEAEFGRLRRIDESERQACLAKWRDRIEKRRKASWVRRLFSQTYPEKTLDEAALYAFENEFDEGNFMRRSDDERIRNFLNSESWSECFRLKKACLVAEKSATETVFVSIDIIHRYSDT